MPTERLYYTDATMLAFDANVVARVGENGVILDRTAFYPTSGGQPHDTGTLGGVRVVDVVDEDDRVIHLLGGPLAIGPVRGEVDAVRRRDHRQQHSAQHLLSALLADRFKAETLSVHFGDEHSTIEVSAPDLKDAHRRDLERMANDVIAESREISVTFESSADASARGLRKPSDREGILRVVSIDGIDRSACGGTHLSRTSEIGSILVGDVEKIRGHARISFLAGDRVLQQAHADRAQLEQLARQLDCGVADTRSLLQLRLDELKQVRSAVTGFESEVAVHRVRALYDSAIADAAGLRCVHYTATTESPALLRAMAQAVSTFSRLRLLITTPAPHTIYFATSADSGFDAGALLKSALTAAGGRGGGSARVAQGTVPDEATLGTVVHDLQPKDTT